MRATISFTIVLCFGLIPSIIGQFFTKKPTDRYIHIRSYRYGKSPSVIRCNRGDRLHLTFSTDDTGHSFFLEEFDIDVKISPAREEVAVFKTSDPTSTPVITKEVTIIAGHPGILNYLVAKSNYRCHVWCGPMHAFEQGKLIILPNTLLLFSLGCITGIWIVWLFGLFRKTNVKPQNQMESLGMKDILNSSVFLKGLFKSRWFQIVMTVFVMVLIYIVIITSVFGTQMSGRNLGVLMMWAIWLFLLVAILTPFGGRIWCTICPLPLFGDLIQRRSFFTPANGRTKGYNNKFFGLMLTWPRWLSNGWFKLIVLLVLATFSTTLIARPKISGYTVLMLLLVPTVLSAFFELRSFCRYVCPVSVFLDSYSGMSFLALRNRSQEVCNNCKPKYCEKGSPDGWACPYGLNAGKLINNAECGLCLECIRSCLYDNVSLFIRPFHSEVRSYRYSDAWTTISLFALAIVYCVLYQGHWPLVRDFVNILDKKNWGMFGIYSLSLWSVNLLILPGIIYMVSFVGIKLTKSGMYIKDAFLINSRSLQPLGLMLWIAFVIPMLFVNITFIIQSASDPFGWGWDFFNTANIPWHQMIPRFIPWLQAILLLTGMYLSLKTIRDSYENPQTTPRQLILKTLPFSLFVIAVTAGMLFFFVN